MGLESNKNIKMPISWTVLFTFKTSNRNIDSFWSVIYVNCTVNQIFYILEIVWIGISDDEVLKQRKIVFEQKDYQRNVFCFSDFIFPYTFWLFERKKLIKLVMGGYVESFGELNLNWIEQNAPMRIELINSGLWN